MIDLLEQSLGFGLEGRRQNGLRRLAGTWSARELSEFERALAPTGQIDAELWK